MNKIQFEIKPGCEITIERRGLSKSEFVVRGLPSNATWMEPGLTKETSYCNVSLSGGAFGGVYVAPGHAEPPPWVSGFGGAVWPGAWPELFTSPPRNNYACGPNHLSPLGLSLFTQAAALDRTSRKWLDEAGAPLCPCNAKPMFFELPPELEPEDEDGDNE